MKKVPAMRTRESSAVLGWFRTAAGTVLLPRASVTFAGEASVPLPREQLLSGCSLKIWQTTRRVQINSKI